MKFAVSAAIVAALALAPLHAAGQGRGSQNPKEKPEATQPAPKADPSQGKAKGKKPGPTAPGSSSGVAGHGSCTPDTTVPVIHSVTATPNVLTTPNHRMTPISIAANVTDNCSTPTWSVTSVTSDEPVNGTGEGDTEPDWTIAGSHSVTLRAERAGSGDGRVYTITITARDGAGNVATSATTVRVPHNR